MLDDAMSIYLNTLPQRAGHIFENRPFALLPPQAQAECEISPGLTGIPEPGQLVYPGRIMLWPAQLVGFVAAVDGRHCAVREHESALRRHELRPQRRVDDVHD